MRLLPLGMIESRHPRQHFMSHVQRLESVMELVRSGEGALATGDMSLGLDKLQMQPTKQVGVCVSGGLAGYGLLTGVSSVVDTGDEQAPVMLHASDVLAVFEVEPSAL
jgi:hypothetical protein